MFLWTRSCEVLLACLIYIDCKARRRFFWIKFKKETEKNKGCAFRSQNKILSLVDFNLPDFFSRYLTSKEQELYSCFLLASLDFNYFFLV